VPERAREDLGLEALVRRVDEDDLARLAARMTRRDTSVLLTSSSPSLRERGERKRDALPADDVADLVRVEHHEAQLVDEGLDARSLHVDGDDVSTVQE